MDTITLKKGKEESLLRRHPWVFSGAIAKASAQIEEGDIVDVLSFEGHFLARGICSTGFITVRVLSFEEQDIDIDWWVAKISTAFALRTALGLTANGATNCYRLIHGEGDSLPGLVVDIYGSVAVMQAHAVGIYLMRGVIADAICKATGVKSVYDKSSGTVPFDSGIEIHDGYIVGGAIKGEVLLENGVKFEAAWEGGQKTGLFIDQRENRELLSRYAAGRRVLNTFCYTGGFSLAAIQGGATSVDSVDSSQRAVELASKNISANFPQFSAHEEIATDALDFIRNMESDKYDMIVLDPPAFAKHRGAIANALQAYKRLNAAAIKKCAPQSIVFTFSCSQAISREQFRTAVFSAAAIAGRNVRILHFLSQPADHPISIYHPEGEYLKGLVLYID